MPLSIVDFTPMGVARKIGSAFGIPDPRDLFNLYTGQSQIEAQKNAIAANLQMNADTNAANLAATRETNKQNYEIWKEARADQRAYFDETNVYNSAAAQVERLKQAGLNPALAMYKGVNAGSTQAQTVPNAPSMIPPQFQAYYQNPVDTSAFQNNLPVIAQMATMGNSIAKSSADLQIAQHSAELIAVQYEKEVLEKVLKKTEVDISTDKNVIQAAIHERISNGVIAMITALNESKKQKATIDSLVAAARKANVEADFTELQKGIFETDKGALNKIEEHLGSSVDSLWWNIAKLVIGYFGGHSSFGFSHKW